ncbi:MAG TPA: hypothetical protein VF092_07110 [Longimicrobium sp.]
MKGFMDDDPLGTNPADIIGIVGCLICFGVYFAGSASSNDALIWLSMAIGIPAVTLKVMSTRAKSRRWHREHGNADASRKA